MECADDAFGYQPHIVTLLWAVAAISGVAISGRGQENWKIMPARQHLGNSFPF
jgi:hypothetical protein